MIFIFILFITQGQGYGWPALKHNSSHLVSSELVFFLVSSHVLLSSRCFLSSLIFGLFLACLLSFTLVSLLFFSSWLFARLISFCFTFSFLDLSLLLSHLMLCLSLLIVFSRIIHPIRSHFCPTLCLCFPILSSFLYFTGLVFSFLSSLLYLSVLICLLSYFFSYFECPSQ